MKTFLATYLGSESGMASWKAMDEETRKQRETAGKDAWKKWAMANAKVIVDQGSPVGKTKRISADGIADTRNQIGAYTIVSAESHDDAAQLFLNHPHFTIFPGDAVEVMECLPMPEM